MVNTNAQMAEFAENLWNNYIREKHNQENADAVSFYRAKVTAKPGGNFLTIQRPYDNAITVPCTTAMNTVSVGTQVLVIRFGNGNNNANHLVVATGDGESQNMARSYGTVTNLNTVFENGLYTYASSATGAPDTATGGVLVVYRFNDNYITQIAYKNSSVGAAISAVRQYASGIWGDWRPFDQTIEGFASMDGSSFAKNFKRLDTTNKFSVYHQKAAFYWSASTSSDFSNIPDGLPTSGSVVGFREVFYRSSIHILVKVTEMYPVAGQEHYNFYNNGSWSGWSTAIPNSYIGGSVGDLDTMPTRGLFGTFFTNMGDSGIAGTKPNTSGGGLFFCLRQSSNITRQIYMPRNHSTVDHYWRYYTHSTGVWTAWDTIYKINDVKTSIEMSAVSVATDTWVSLGSYTFGPGTYMIRFLGSFTSNATGRRAVTISSSATTEGTSTELMRMNAVNGARTNVECLAMRQFTSDTTLYFNVWQNSGSALSTYGRLSYIRMGY